MPKVAGQEAKEVCRTDQMGGGLEDGIEGVIHDMRLMWNNNDQEEK